MSEIQKRFGKSAWGTILKRDPHDEDALALMKEIEEDCLENGIEKDLAEIYHGQVYILIGWGCFDEALTLLEKAEALSLKNGNKKLLSQSYSYKGLIFYYLSHLENALSFFKKAEGYLKLGDKNELWRIYGNQAITYHELGRFEEALALFKNAETLCLELSREPRFTVSDWKGKIGEDIRASDLKSGLLQIYRNKALTYHDCGRFEEALEVTKKEEAICLELGNREGLPEIYGRQAHIFSDWGRLKEALEHHKKEEGLCLEIGLRSSLSYCYYRWGLLSRKLKDKKTEREKLEEALQICTELNLHWEREQIQKEIEKIS